jgi:hypothetical protein
MHATSNNLRRCSEHSTLLRVPGCEFLGLRLPNLLRPATPQGQQREARRVLFGGGDGGHVEDGLLQCKPR